MSFPHLPIAWSFQLLGDTSSPILADSAKFTDWVQAGAAALTAFITLAAAYYAYRTLYHMRQSSHEDAVRNARDRTLKDVKPAYERTKECLQRIANLSKAERRKPEHQRDIKDTLNGWEEVALGVATGIYDDQLLYDVAGKFIQGFYREVSWVIRTCRLHHRHYFDELEELIERVNDIECAGYEIDRPAIARLRRLYVPRDVLKLLRTLPAHYADHHKFESDLDQRARERGVSIDFYKATIFKETRAKLPAILRLTRDELQRLTGAQRDRLSRSLVHMFQKIHEYTGKEYPALGSRSLADWVESEEAKNLCRFIAFDKGRNLDSSDPEIVGHVALEDLEASGRWESLFTDLSDKTAALLQHALDRKTCVVIKELYLHEATRASRAGKGLYRRLLRRAIETVEEHHLDKEPDQAKWALLALVRPAAADSQDPERQKRIIEAEGGESVPLDEPEGMVRSPDPCSSAIPAEKPREKGHPQRSGDTTEGMPMDFYLFGQEFKGEPAAAEQKKHTVKPR